MSIETTSDSKSLETTAVVHQNRPVVLGELGPASFSIKTMFQITTGSAIFFACLLFSPILAIVLTLFVSPAIIRTGLISDIHRRKQLDFGWPKRLAYFAGSIAIVTVTFAIAGAAFVATCLLFGLMGMTFSAMVGSGELSTDAAVVGTAGGIVWGIAAAMLAFGMIVLKAWLPKNLTANS